MLEKLNPKQIKLSIIIPCWQQNQISFDFITNLEYQLEFSYEIIILCDRNLVDCELKEILTYLETQGHQILGFELPLQQQDIFNQAIFKAKGEYIAWIPYPPLSLFEQLQEAFAVLEENLEVSGLYLDQVNDGQKTTNPNEMGVILRKSIWESEITLKEPSEIRNGKFEFKKHPNPLIADLFAQKMSTLNIKTNLQPQNYPVKAKELPLVSVCIPAYNGEQFIAEAISSVLSQTYPAIELIISDDNSQDNTLAIAQSFQEQTPIPISIFTHTPLGLAQNSNFCIEQAQGTYIKFLYQDDILLPNCIEKMVSLAETDPQIGLVFSPRTLFFLNPDEKNLDLISVYQEFSNLHQSWSNLKPIQWGTELLADSNLWEHPINKIGEPSTVLIKKSVFAKVAGFDPNLNQLVDLDLWWRIFGQFKVGFCEEHLSYFRLHAQQKTYQNMQENQAVDTHFYYKVYCHPDYDIFSPLSRYQAYLIYNLISKE